jgi:hypothetical protein
MMKKKSFNQPIQIEKLQYLVLSNISAKSKAHKNYRYQNISQARREW